MWCSATALVLLVAVAVSGVRCKGSRFISTTNNNTNSLSNANCRNTASYITESLIYSLTPTIESVVYASSTSSSPSSSSTSSTSSSSTSSTSSSSTSTLVSSFSRENEANAPVSGSYPRRCSNIDGECSTSYVRLPDNEVGNLKVFADCGKSNNGDTSKVIVTSNSSNSSRGNSRTIGVITTSNSTNTVNSIVNGTSFHLTGIVTTSIVIGSGVSGLFCASV